MTDDSQKEVNYDVLLLKFVVSAIIDRSRDRDSVMEYIRANLGAFSGIVGSSRDGEFFKGRIQELLDFLEPGDKRPIFSGSPPKLRLVRSTDTGTGDKP